MSRLTFERGEYWWRGTWPEHPSTSPEWRITPPYAFGKGQWPHLRFMSWSHTDRCQRSGCRWAVTRLYSQDGRLWLRRADMIDGNLSVIIPLLSGPEWVEGEGVSFFFSFCLSLSSSLTHKGRKMCRLDRGGCIYESDNMSRLKCEEKRELFVHQRDAPYTVKRGALFGDGSPAPLFPPLPPSLSHSVCLSFFLSFCLALFLSFSLFWQFESRGRKSIKV